MASKTPQNHNNTNRIDIPGKNDLEILENLKSIIKSNQHDAYKPIPRPEALLYQYHGSLTYTPDRASHDGLPPRALKPSSFETPPQQHPTSAPPGSSGEVLPPLMSDSRRASLIHDLPARPGQPQRPDPPPTANGHLQPRNVGDSRRSEAPPGDRQTSNHYSPPHNSAQEHYTRDRDERGTYERPREALSKDDRERSPATWDARRPSADYRERRDDRRTFQPRPPPEDRHYEPSPERSAALEAARRPPDDVERGRYADSFYPSRERRPSDAASRMRPEDRSYRPSDNGSRPTAYPSYATEPYTPPTNRDAPPPRSASVYDRDPATPAARSLDKTAALPAPSLEARLDPPPARPSLQDRIGPPSTPTSVVSPPPQNSGNASSKPAPSLEQRLAMPPPSSSARPGVTQQSPSVSTNSAASAHRPNYPGTHYSPSSARDPTGQEQRVSGERVPERYTRSPPPRETTGPRPAPAQSVTAREDSRNIALKREPSPHGGPASSASIRGGTYRSGDNDSRAHNGSAPAARRDVADADRYESAGSSASYNKPQHPADSREADRSGRPSAYSQAPPARNSPAPANSAEPPSSTSNNPSERRSLALSREMQDALYKPPQHFTPMPPKDADRRRETYPAEDSYRPRPTWTERDREASAPRGSYPPIDERDHVPVYREQPPPRAVYESQSSRPLSARLADPYPIDERDRSYHPPPSSAGLPPDARDYERSRYPSARPLDPLPPSSQAIYPPPSRVRQRSPSPIMDSRRGGMDMRPPPMKRPRDDMYSAQQPPPSSSGSSYYPPPRDYRDGASSYYPVDSGRDMRPREADYVYDARGRPGDGYPPRYVEDERDRRYMPPPRTS